MRYEAELAYWQDQADFPFWDALRVTVRTVAPWCRFYRAELLAPTRDAPAERRRHGLLPADPAARAAFVDDLVGWLQHYDEARVFRLQLNSTPFEAAPALFDRPDDDCCWTLTLTEAQFRALQAAWASAGLPTDLFYPEGVEVVVEHRRGGCLGFTWEFVRAFTPRQGREHHRKSV